MRYKLLLFVLFVSFSGHNLLAQTSGTSIFFPGHWLEIGQAKNGSFGPGPAPAGYYPFTGTNLASVYDWGHDGWATGAPPFMGDYTYPGTPFEGWSMQANGTRSDAFYTDGGSTGTSFTGGLTGANVAYSNLPGPVFCGAPTDRRLIGTWAGAASGLTIHTVTRLDSNASWVVMTTSFINNTAASIPGVYFWRTADPDNDETRSGYFETNNFITHQNETADHPVMVSSYGTVYNQAYMALATKDCRAKAMIYDSWSPYPAAGGLDQVYAGTAGFLGTTYYTLGQETADQDIAIGLIYNLGTIAAGDSAVISYAYIYNSVTGIDSAFPEPKLYVNCVPIAPSGAAPAPTYDTFNVCLYPGMTTLPVSILYGDDKCWYGSTWTWSPSTGLASVTGVTNTITTTGLPPVITYTITGTNAAFCNARTMYLTVHTCNGATVNSPCLGDSLIFNAPGDSTGATYVWVGPNSYTTTVATTQSFTVYPSVWADTGTYRVIKTVAGIHDTSTTVVIIHPNPTVTAGSNSPFCSTITNTLTLTSTTSVPVSTYAWTGPAGFTSSVQNPVDPTFTAAGVGTYSITVTTTFGCKGSATTNVAVFPPPGVPTVTEPATYCYGAIPVPFHVDSAAGATVYWYTSAAGGIGTIGIPSISTTTPGTFTFYYNQTIGLCASAIDSITVVVYPKITPGIGTPVYHLGCVQDTVYFTNDTAGANASSYLWNFGDGTTSTSIDPMHIYSPQNIYTVTLTDYFAGCSKSTTTTVNTKHTVQAAFHADYDSVCFNPGPASSIMIDNSTATVQGGPGQINTYAWTINGSPAANTRTPVLTFPAPNTYGVTLVVTDSIGCISTWSENVYVLGINIDSWHDTSLCMRQPLPLNNKESNNLGLVDYTYAWAPADGHLTSDTAHVPYFNAGYGPYTYVLTASLVLPSGNVCFEKDTMVIHVIIPAQLQNVTANTSITYGSSVQLNADNELYYWWAPDNGTLNNPNINNPIATPDTTTTYTIIGMDKYGCTDTNYVVVHVDSTMNEWIPTGFTPNGDGLNDYFHPVGLKFQNLVDFRVYNRWGQVVFYTSDANSKGWDGTFNGVPQDMGVYFYSIIVGRPGGNGADIIYKGDVTLIR